MLSFKSNIMKWSEKHTAVFMLGDRRYSSFEIKLSNRAVVNKFLTSLKDFMAEKNPTYHQAFLFFLVFFFWQATWSLTVATSHFAYS